MRPNPRQTPRDLLRLITVRVGSMTITTSRVSELVERGLDIHGDLTRFGITDELLRALSFNQLDGWTVSSVEALARAASLDPAVVWRSEPLPRTPGLAFLRAGPWPDFLMEDYPVVLAALERGAGLRALASMLGKEFLDVPLRSAPGHEPWRDGYGLATRVRETLDLGIEPIPDTMPSLICERFGLHVEIRTLATSRLEGVTAVREDGGSILLSDRLAPTLMARTLVHELCHALFDPFDDGMMVTLDGEEQANVEPREQRARAFAAEFTAPLAGLKDVLGAPENEQNSTLAQKMTLKAAMHYGAPYELTANHLNHRGFISGEARDHLVRQALRPRVDRARLEPPTTLDDWAEEAVQEGLISRRRAHELCLQR